MEIQDKYLNLSNAELRIKLKNMEDEYEAIKAKITKDLERMKILDKEYISMKQVLNKRTKGRG